MTNNNLVSIIIPVYNSSKYIEETIKSINEQTYTNYEAIFIDDFSVDNSVQIIEEYKKINPKFKLIKLKRHIGVSKARNIGIRKAKGRYLTFLDSDDIWIKNKLEEQIKYIQKYNVEFIYSSFRYINDKGTKVSKKIKVKPKLDYKKALLDTRILTTTAMIDLSKIPKRYCYMPDIMNEDVAVWWRILKKGYFAYAQDKVLAYYRKSKNSRSSRKTITVFYRWKLYRSVEKLSLIKSAYCFINYLLNAIIKRIGLYKKIKKYDEKSLEVAVSTQNLNNKESIQNLIKKMKITSAYLIINQNSDNIYINNKNVINRNEKGLSKSRNEAIKNSKHDIILFADDDVTYSNDYKKIIVDAYNKYQDSDIICFYVESKNKTRKIKKMHTGKIGYIRAMRIASVEISFKQKSILNNNIKFDENFGVGSKFNRGEEQIFLYDALKEGLKIFFVNKKIGEVKQENSTWFSNYDKDFFKIQGQVFKRMSPKFYKLLIIQYAIRKYFLYHNTITLKDAIYNMLKN